MRTTVVLGLALACFALGFNLYPFVGKVVGFGHNEVVRVSNGLGVVVDKYTTVVYRIRLIDDKTGIVSKDVSEYPADKVSVFRIGGEGE